MNAAMPYAQNSGVSVTIVLNNDSTNDAIINSTAAVTTINAIIITSQSRNRKKLTPAPAKNVDTE